MELAVASAVGEESGSWWSERSFEGKEGERGRREDRLDRRTVATMALYCLVSYFLGSSRSRVVSNIDYKRMSSTTINSRFTHLKCSISRLRCARSLFLSISRPPSRTLLSLVYDVGIQFGLRQRAFSLLKRFGFSVFFSLLGIIYHVS